MEQIYYGQLKCQAVTSSGSECTNGAYYQVGTKYLCGVHSKNKDRIELPKNKERITEIKDDLYKLHLKTVDSDAKRNQIKGVKGTVMLTKLLMKKDPKLIPGFMNIFPNFKDQNRKYGFGCKSLSPKYMGPIKHPQHGLPVSKNLENFWQGSKCFPCELDEKGNPSDQFYKTRLEMFTSSKPMRHKTVAKDQDGNKNIPEYSVWTCNDGSELHLKYFEARQIYCHYYTLFALESPDFIKLKKMINDGVNINICGYDAYQPEMSLEDCYKDTSRPFGHELVLYSLLMNERPWEKYTTINFN